MGVLLKFARFKDISLWSVDSLIENLFGYNKNYELVKISNFLSRNKTKIRIEDDIVYKRVTIKMNNNGIFLRDTKIGKEIGTKNQFIIKEGQFLLSKIDARNGAFGVVTKEVDGGIITGNFWTFDVDYSKINPHFLSLITTTKQFMQFAQSASSGTTGRHYLQENKFLDVKIPLPSLDIQKKLLEQVNQYEKELKNLKFEFDKLLKQFNKNIFLEVDQDDSLLKFINFKQLHNWSVQNLSENNFNYNQKYNLVKISSFLKRDKTLINIDDDTTYKRVTIRTKNQGVSIRDTEIGKNIGTKKQYIIKKGQFLLSKIDARNGAFGIATDELSGAIITADFFAYNIDKTKIEPYFLSLITTTKQFIQFAQNSSTGTTNRQRLNEELFLNVEIPLPTIDEQKELIRDLQNNLSKQDTAIQNKTLALQEFEREIFNET